MMSRSLLSRKPAAAQPTRVAVEHRHDDRHVAAADRRDQVPPEEEREHGHRAEQRCRTATAECGCSTGNRHQHEGDDDAQVEQVPPGSTSGADLIRADNLRKATIEPVSVTAPMKTPTKTSTSWDLRQDRRDSSAWTSSTRRARPRVRQTVQQRDELRHAGHLDRARAQMPMAAPIAIAPAISPRPIQPEPGRSAPPPAGRRRRCHRPPRGS